MGIREGFSGESVIIETEGDCVLLVHAAVDLVDNEWRRFISTCSDVCQRHSKLKILVFTPGPAPNLIQRTMLSDLADQYPITISVCTDSKLARGVIRAVGWTAKAKIAPFEPTSIPQAMKHLALDDTQAGAVTQKFTHLLRHWGPAN